LEEPVLWSPKPVITQLSLIDSTPGGDIAASSVQGAINELDSEKVSVSGDNMTGSLTMDTENELRFADNAGGEYVGFKAPNTVPSSFVWDLPASDGGAGQALITNGSGALSWTTFGTGNGDLLNGGNAGAVVVGSNDNTLSLEANGSTAMTVTASGYVGVGTSNPSQELQVIGPNPILEVGPGTDASSNAILRLTGKNTGTPTIADIWANFNGGLEFRPGAEGYIFRDSSDNQRLRITDSGNMGIGTTTPSGILDIEGGDVFIGTGTLTNASGSEDLSVTGNIEADGTIYGAFVGDGSGLTNIPAAAGTLMDGGNSEGTTLTIGTNDNHAVDFITNNTFALTILQDGDLVYRSENGARFQDSVGSDYVRLKAPNDVTTTYTLTLPPAIGTSGQALITDGSGNLSWTSVGSGSGDLINGGNTGAVVVGSNDDTLSLEASGSTAITVLGNGNVGIGSTNPSVRLDVEGGDVQLDADAALTFGVNKGLGDLGGGNFNMFSSANIRFYADTNNDTTGEGFFFYGDQSVNSTGNPILALLDTGYTGVGDETPDAYLELSANGDDTNPILMVSTDDGNDGDLLIVNGSGLVGVGTTAPSGKLHISDDSEYSLRVETTNTASGVSPNRIASFLNPTMASGNLVEVILGRDESLNDRATWMYRYSGNGSTSNSQSWGFYNNTDLMTLMASGNLGIGTTAPGAKLDINGDIRLRGATSGYVGFQAPATAGNNIWTLPTGDGSSGQVLQTDGSGNLSWGAGGYGNGDIIRAANGTAGAPSLTFDSDPDTGIYQQGTNSIGFTAGGSIRASLNNSNLQVYGIDIQSNTAGSFLLESSAASAASPTYTFAGDADVGIWRPGADQIGFSTAATERMRIDASGNVGVGTNTPTARMDIESTLTATSGTSSGVRLDTSVAPAGASTGQYNGLRNWLNVSTANDGDRLSVSENILLSFNSGTFNDVFANYSLTQSFAGTFTNAFGTYSSIGPGGTGIMTNARAIAGSVGAGAGGTIGDGRGGYFSVDAGLGTITTGYGIYIDNVTATTEYGLYQAGSDDLNFFAGDTIFDNEAEVRFEEATGNGNNYVGFKAAATLTGDQIWTLPTADGTSGQVLQTDGSGNLSFTTVAGGGGDLLNGGNSGAVVVGSNDNTLSLEASGSTAITVLGNGNVGIGTATPSNLLEIYGDANSSQVFSLSNNDSGNNATAGIVLGNDLGNIGELRSYSSGYILPQFRNRFVLASDFTNGQGIDIIATGSTSDLRFYTDGTTTSDERMRIDASGNVGIGTNLPAAPLHTYGRALFEEVPGETIDIGSAHTHPAIEFENGGDRAKILLDGLGTFKLMTGTSNSSHLTVNLSGNVGIGTPTAEGQLDVNGDIRMLGSTSGYSGFRAPATAGNNVWTLPTGDGTSGQVLSTDGSGNLSWASSGGGGDFLANGTVAMSGNLNLNNNNIINVAGGSEATPSISFNGDPDTGIFSLGADIFNFGTGGSGRVQVSSQGLLIYASQGLRFNDSDDSNTVGLYPPDDVTSNYNLILPPAGPSAGQILESDASGVLSWVTPASGGGDLLNGGNTGAVVVGSNDNTLSLEANGSTAMTINASGNIGIGTLNPSRLLDVEGSIQASELILDGTVANSINFEGSFDNGINAGAAGTSDLHLAARDELRFVTGGVNPATNTRLIISGSGNVGIGTSNPQTPLHVDGNLRVEGTNGMVQVLSGNSITYSRNGMNYLAAVAGASSELSFDSTLGYTFQIASTDRVTIDSNGRLGIGTDAPGGLLDVNGDIRMLGSASGYVGFQAPPTAGNNVWTLPTGDGTSGQVLSTDGSGNLSWATAGGGSGDLLNGGNSGAVVVGSNDDTLSLEASGSTAMTIDGSGSVGIGTTAPSGVLTVEGSSPTVAIRGSVDDNPVTLDFLGHDGGVYEDGFRLVYSDDTTQNYFRIQSNNNNSYTTHFHMERSTGQVAIGSGLDSGINFGDELTVRSLNEEAAIGITAGGGEQDAVVKWSTGDTWTMGVDDDASDNLVISRGDTLGTNDVMTFNNSGYVGIGTTTPDNILEVHGPPAVVRTSGSVADFLNLDNLATSVGSGVAINFRSNNTMYGAVEGVREGTNLGSLRFSTRGTSPSIGVYERVRIDQNGNVGIGTDAPGSKLDVAGDLRLRGATSGYVGFQAPATAGNNVWTLPTGDGTSGQVLSTDGSGNLSWTSVGGGSGDLLNGGNSGAVVMGSNDNTLSLEASGLTAVTVLGNGNVGVGTANPTRNFHVQDNQNAETTIRLRNSSTGTLAASVYEAGPSFTNHGEFGFGSTGHTWASNLIRNRAYLFSTSDSDGLVNVTEGTDPIIFATNTNERMRIDGSGNVGIGTTTPDNILEVHGPPAVVRTSGSVADFLNLDNLATSVGSGAAINFRSNNTMYGAVEGVREGTNLGSLRFSTRGTTPSIGVYERVRIDQNGNVGIGTDAPGSKLDVAGDLRLRGATSGYVGFQAPATAGNNVWTLPTADGTSGQVLVTDGSGNLSWVANGSGAGDFMANGSVAMTGTLDLGNNRVDNLNAGTEADPSLSFNGDNDTGIYSGGSDQISMTFGGHRSLYLGSDRFDFISSDGNSGDPGFFGYGAASQSGVDLEGHRSNGGGRGSEVLVPQGYKLLGVRARGYDGNSYETAAEILFNTDAATGAEDMPGRITFLTTPDGSNAPVERMRIDSGGEVGIGTNNPRDLLHLTGGSLRLSGTDMGNDSGADLIISRNDREPYLTIDDEGNGAISIGANTSGVGTIATGSGDLEFRTGITWNAHPSSSGNVRMTIANATGNLGIGTTSPTAKLEVAGQIRSVNSSGAAEVNGSASIDWNNGNAQSLSVDCATTTFTNMLDGGTYMLAVTETGTSTCTFSQAGLTFYFHPANGNRTSGQRTVYTFQRIGNDVYVSWIAGFQ
jgi:fibronectin-binding autotransporter adhesin